MVPDVIGKEARQGPCHPASCGRDLDLLLKVMEVVIIIKPVGEGVSTLIL